MTEGILVNHAALEAAVVDMQSTMKKIDDRLNRLESELKPLKSEWHGDAKATYEVTKAQWDKAILDMRNLLNDTQQGVSNSNVDYRAADRRGAGFFESI